MENKIGELGLLLHLIRPETPEYVLEEISKGMNLVSWDFSPVNVDIKSDIDNFLPKTN
ncbi:MAG: hypothetical protein ABIA91_02555 [Patescibacteria group bacterium]